jgi:thiamine biosynthesis lipoprotein
MYTTVSVTVTARNSEEAEKNIEIAFNEIRELERLLSFWTNDSEIAAINQSAGGSPVKISKATFQVIEKAIEISDITGGAFDATIGPVIRQWDFKKQKLPDDAALKDALGKVNYKAMVLDQANSTAYLSDREMSFDTGGIAKGFAADKVIEKLKALNVSAALVSVAGDIRGYGEKPDGTKWRVGIRDPRSDDEEMFIASVELNDEAISTSGDYERYFIRNKKRYHHILDPKTGYPAEGTMSVTVVADTATYADGLSTGVFVLGPETGIKALDKAGIDGLIISSDKKAYITDGLASRIKWVDPQYKP